jgi:hypothetical protein
MPMQPNTKINQLLDTEIQNNKRKYRFFDKIVGLPMLLSAVYIWFFYLKESLHIVPQTKAIIGISLFIITIPICCFIAYKLEKRNINLHTGHVLFNQLFWTALGLISLITSLVAYFVYGI